MFSRVAGDEFVHGVLWRRKSISHRLVPPMPLPQKLGCCCRCLPRLRGRDMGLTAALPPPEVPCPAPLMTLFCSWAAAAADAAIVSLTIIQILDLLVTETFFFLSSQCSISYFDTPGTGLGTALQWVWCRGGEPVTPSPAVDMQVNSEGPKATVGLCIFCSSALLQHYSYTLCL